MFPVPRHKLEFHSASWDNTFSRERSYDEYREVTHMPSLWELLLYSALGMLVVFFAWRVKNQKEELRQLEEENERKKKESSKTDFDE